MIEASSFYSTIRYRVAPPVFVLFFTYVTKVLVVIGNPESNFGSSFNLVVGLQSTFAWKLVLTFYLWCFLSLKLPGSKTFSGPPTPTSGYVPVYVANGTQFYLVSLIAFLILSSLQPELCLNIYRDFGSIVLVLNATALLLCCYLMIKGKTNPEDARDDAKPGEYPLPYLFYRGIELHPRILGVDVKQWTNCRVGMMGWALLSLSFCVAGIQIHGLTTASYGQIANACLINIYLFKFFHWETGYFNTLDITLDRAGYYLCWGCLVWVQVFYTFSTYFMVGHQPKIGLSTSFAIFLFGCISTALNYITDRQKEKFRATDGNCLIWGRPAKYLDVEFKDSNGTVKRSRLMLSGFWGLARHMNYTYEIMLAISWSLPASGYGFTPFMYPIFIIILLLHRTFRDEEKCSAKYGPEWTKYCQAVPYRLLPQVF